MKKYLLFITVVICFAFIGQIQAQKANHAYLIIGTYTAGKSEGIYVYDFDEATAKLTYVSKVKTSNPSYLAVATNEQFVYAVNEKSDSTRFTTTGSISAFSFDNKDGSLKELNTQSSGGKHPCYVTIDKTGKWVIAANYTSGSLAVLPIKENGLLDTPIQVIQHVGSGADKARQQGPHVHSVVFSNDNKTLFVQDLGIDKIMLYHFDATTGKLTEALQPFIQSKPAAGPRHFEFHPSGKFGYLIEELSNTVSVLAKDENGIYQAIQTISSVPKNYKGGAAAADIHLSKDGSFLYASNRGESNTIGIFSVDNLTGKLTLIGHQPVLGIMPRNFVIDPTGNFLLVANQQSNNITVFKRNTNTGLLTFTDVQIEVGNPVCLKWVTGLYFQAKFSPMLGFEPE